MKRCCLLIAFGCHFFTSVAQDISQYYLADSAEYISTLEQLLSEQETYFISLIDSVANSPIDISLSEGWNNIGYPLKSPINVAAALYPIHQNIEVIKDNEGHVYIPQFAFNGIGDFTPGLGYQIKMNNAVASFSFTTENIAVNYLFEIEGCTEPTAPNYWPLANKDDGSCLIDTDNDLIYDTDEIQGCQDGNACNYNPLATDAGECLYPVPGYDCNDNCINDSDGDLICDEFEIEGCLDINACNYNENTTELIECVYAENYYDCDDILTVEIGDEVFGGIVFYMSEDLKTGLVVSTNDQSNSANWGCQGNLIDGANNDQIGSGLQNTLNIISDCSQNNIAAKICSELTRNGYDDWYLPSKDELNLIFTNLHSQGLGNFSSIYWSSSQYSDFFAWIQNFNGGSQNYDGKYANRQVRAVRSF